MVSFPGKIPTGPMVSHVKRIVRPYSIDRKRPRDDSQVGSGENYESDATVADLYLYEESDTNDVVQQYGEVRRGSLQGICPADADIEIGDRVEYGESKYELVEPIRGIPDNNTPDILRLSFERVEVQSQADINL